MKLQKAHKAHITKARKVQLFFSETEIHERICNLCFLKLKELSSFNFFQSCFYSVWSDTIHITVTTSAFHVHVVITIKPARRHLISSSLTGRRQTHKSFAYSISLARFNNDKSIKLILGNKSRSTVLFVFDPWVSKAFMLFRRRHPFGDDLRRY